MSLMHNTTNSRCASYALQAEYAEIGIKILQYRKLFQVEKKIYIDLDYTHRDKIFTDV